MTNQNNIVQTLRIPTPRRLEHLGFYAHRATKNLPQSADETLFRIANGKVLVTAIIGEVTTVVQTQANNTRLKLNPTTGSDIDLCANLDITADAVKTLYVCTGTLATALVASIGVGLLQATPWILDVGDIELDCAASNSGQVKWDLFWNPIDGGTVEVIR